MHSFSAMTKVQKEKKNTSPRTAPAMSCSRLKSYNVAKNIIAKLTGQCFKKFKR